MSQSNDSVNHPVHYQPKFSTRPVECIDITRNMPFCSGNAFKYIWRSGDKGDNAKAIEDCQKALWYLDDALKHTSKNFCILKTAKEIFKWIQPEDTNKYEALAHIVLGAFEFAKDDIKRMIKDFENEN